MIQKFVTGATINVVFVVAGNTQTFNGATVIEAGAGHIEIMDSNSVNRVYPWHQVHSIALV